MYDQLDDTLRSITMQLRSAIQADANGAAPASDASDPLQRANGWARKLSVELASVLLGTLGLAATIEWHLRQFQTCTGIPCDLTLNNSAGFDLPEDYAETIFDIYNEALSNVARHAKASRAAIALTIAPREVILVVADNGVGLDKAVPTSGTSGLAAIRARAQTYQGTCEIAGAPNTGTTLTVSLPIS